MDKQVEIHGVVIQEDPNESSLAEVDSQELRAPNPGLDFNPNPVASKAVILASFVPKPTPKKIAFCKATLAGLVKNKAKYDKQFNSCLQDADSPSVARTVAKVIKVAKVQQKKAIVAQKKEVKKIIAEEKAAIKAAAAADLSPERTKLEKEAARLAKLAEELRLERLRIRDLKPEKEERRPEPPKPEAPQDKSGGFWVGQHVPNKVNAEGKLCPGCEKIIYNTDSPLSDEDKKLLHKLHADLVLDDVKLLGQHTLDRAQLAVADADYAKKKLLDRYPVKEN